MNKDSSVEDKSRRPLPSISGEEFDAKFDAGEDVSAYIDWDRAVMVQPGELSPGQKLSLIQTWLDDLLATHPAPPSLLHGQANLNIPVSPLALMRLAKEAARCGLSREALVQSWIEQKLEAQKATK